DDGRIVGKILANDGLTARWVAEVHQHEYVDQADVSNRSDLICHAERNEASRIRDSSVARGDLRMMPLVRSGRHRRFESSSRLSFSSMICNEGWRPRSWASWSRFIIR